jgi:predicted nucleic acid-binding protein
VTSFLTKTEVMRELVAGQGIDKEKVEEFWNDFINLLKCYYVKEFSFDEEIVNIAGSLKLKLRTLVNFFHLFVARSRNAYFVSGDKDMVEKARKAKIYDKIVTYIELRQLISSFS